MATATAAVTEIKKPAIEAEPPVFRGEDVALEEFRNNRFRAYAPARMTTEDLSKPHTWRAPRERLKPYDIVMVLAADESWIAEVLITESQMGTGVEAIVVRTIKLPAKRATGGARIPPGHDILRDGTTNKYFVKRLRDDVTMQSGFDEHELALRWLLDHASIRQG